MKILAGFQIYTSVPLTSIKNDIVQKLVIFMISRFIEKIPRKTRWKNLL